MGGKKSPAWLDEGPPGEATKNLYFNTYKFNILLTKGLREVGKVGESTDSIHMHNVYLYTNNFNMLATFCKLAFTYNRTLNTVL